MTDFLNLVFEPYHCLKIDNPNLESMGMNPHTYYIANEWYKWFIVNGGQFDGTSVLLFPDEKTKLMFILKFSYSSSEYC